MALTGHGKGPVVLLLAAHRWISTARLAMALVELGCVVEMMAPAAHPAMVTGAVSTMHRFDPLHPVPSLQRALELGIPAAVIAADELMLLALEELWWTSDARLPEDAKRDAAARALIERSIGKVGTLGVGRSRMAFMRLAKGLGLNAPGCVAIENANGVDVAMQQLGLPLVLKADVSSGGRGVVIVEEASRARGVWKMLHQPVNLPHAMMRGLRYKEWAHLRQSAKGETRDISAQQYVAGAERTSMVMCHDGEVLGMECLEVVRRWEVRGPSSVVRVIHDATMDAAIRKIVKQLGLSGFCGFDFIQEAESGQRLLIEMNLRPTQLSHLAMGAERDLVAAYVRGVLGLDVEDRAAAVEGDLIALFPQELQRDAGSEFLGTGYHDVPWENPALMEVAMRGLPAGVLRGRQVGGG